MLSLLSFVIALAALFSWISSRWLKLPSTIGTMLLTVISSVLLAFVPGFHAWALHHVQQIDFERLILHGMLSLLLFAGAFLLEFKYLAREKLAVGLLSLLGTILSTAGVAALTGWIAPLAGIRVTVLQCLLFGALISSTDPIAVLEMLRRVHTPRNLQAQLAGESLFNDGIAAVLFLAFLEAARGTAPTFSHISELLLLRTGGGILLGIALAWFVSHLMQAIEGYHIEILLSLALALGGYAIADSLRLSAPLEAVTAGIALRRLNMRHPVHAISHAEIDHFWEAIDEVQNAVLFVLLGCEFLIVSFDRPTMIFGAASIVIVNAVRVASVAIVLLLLKFVQRKHASSLLVLSWGGLRGGLSIALALSVPAALGRQWILTATYIVVLFSVVIQGGTMDLFLRRFSHLLHKWERARSHSHHEPLA
ncbi:MAG: sodium:proton antiporter [Alloacidobacterium sp.]|jgi:CPA1 family monovalent cation:H+ antiporter